MRDNLYNVHVGTMLGSITPQTATRVKSAAPVTATSGIHKYTLHVQNGPTGAAPGSETLCEKQTRKFNSLTLNNSLALNIRKSSLNILERRRETLETRDLSSLDEQHSKLQSVVLFSACI